MIPKVSIIIPVFNAESYLQRTLEDILHQTYQAIEIIVVDDSSTDSSLAIARSFESNAVKVVSQPNAGAAIARNTGVALATGAYIQFLDADDYLSHDKIEKQVSALECNPGKVAVCNYVQFDKDDCREGNFDFRYQEKFIFSSDDPSEYLINLYGGFGGYNFVQTNCWLVPRTVIDKSGGWREFRCPDDDGEFFSRVLMASLGVVYIPGVINYYRKPLHGPTLSGNNHKKYLQNSLLSIDLKCRTLAKNGESLAFKKAFATQYFEFAVYNYPQNIILSKIAEKRFKTFGMKIPLPMLGGKILMKFGQYFGWKITRIIIYYLKEKRLFR